jgi:exopolysaccharide biosynthesis polyprenyl glycosylphosphotransferase
MPGGYRIFIVLAPFVWIAVFHSFGLYSPDRFSGAEKLRRVISAVSIGWILMMMASFWTQSAFSRAWVGLTWVLALLFEAVSRRSWDFYFLSRGHVMRRTLIVGTREEAQRFCGALRDSASGFLPIGYVAASDPFIVPQGDGLRLVGRIENLAEVISRERADCIFVVSSEVDCEKMSDVLDAARPAKTEVRVVANLPQLLTTRLTVQDVGGFTTLSLKSAYLSGFQSATKRALDLTVATTALIFTLPLWAAIAIAVKLSSPGPIFFKQERVTKGGRQFTMYKFRTMVGRGSEVLEERGVDLTTPFFKLGKEDPRLTSVGSLLRRLSIDELPQLLNVIKGEMSLVGPRPLPADQVAANLDLLRSRHDVPAGITGWWQIQGRSEIPPQEAVQMDVFYIENWSLALDLFILMKTLSVVTTKRGAI